jgi:hypothetical protein
MNATASPARLALAAVVCFCAASLHAQEKEPRADVPPSVLKRYDRNKNGVLDEAERAKWAADLAARREKAQAERAAMLEKYDTNKDGKLSEEEGVAFKLERERERSEQEAERLKVRAAKLKAEREAKERAEQAAEKEAGAPAPKGEQEKPEQKSAGDGMMMME